MKIVFILIMSSLCFGFKFSPMSQSLFLGDSKKAAQFTVENDTQESMAIELTVKERIVQEDGTESLPPTTVLKIFPPQIIIPPKEKRTVRVTWNGDKELPMEKSFRVIAEQLPLNVDKKKKQTGIQMLMRYMAAFYVTPDNAEPNIKATIEKSTQDTMSLRLRNIGKRHQIIANPKINFKKGDLKWKFSDTDLKSLQGENVLAGSTRVFTITTKQQIPLDAEVLIKIED